MTYNVFGGTLNLAQSQSYRYNRRQIWCFNYGNVKKRTFTDVFYMMSMLQTFYFSLNIYYYSCGYYTVTTANVCKKISRIQQGPLY